MRLWTVHPRYLDSKGLVALWREALLAQKVLQGKTRGYRAHPQLQRFKETSDLAAAIASYLSEVYKESVRRGYKFDVTKIGARRYPGRIEETAGQLRYEWARLRGKLAQRAPAVYAAWEELEQSETHSLFRIVAGDVREWEKVS